MSRGRARRGDLEGGPSFGPMKLGRLCTWLSCGFPKGSGVMIDSRVWAGWLNGVTDGGMDEGKLDGGVPGCSTAWMCMSRSRSRSRAAPPC